MTISLRVRPCVRRLLPNYSFSRVSEIPRYRNFKTRRIFVPTRKPTRKFGKKFGMQGLTYEGANFWKLFWAWGKILAKKRHVILSSKFYFKVSRKSLFQNSNQFYQLNLLRFLFLCVFWEFWKKIMHKLLEIKINKKKSLVQ